MTKEQNFNSPVQNVAGHDINISQSGNGLSQMQTDELLNLEKFRLDKLERLRLKTIKSWPFITLTISVAVFIVNGVYVFFNLMETGTIRGLSSSFIIPFWLMPVWALFLVTIVSLKFDEAIAERDKHKKHLCRIQQELMDRGER